MSLLLAILGLPLVLLLPGLITLTALAPLHRLDLLERIYLALAISLLASGWLGLVLAQAGLFSAGLLLALLGLYVVGLGWIAWRRERWRWEPLDRSGRASFVFLAALGVTVLFVVLALPPFEVILGPRDAAVYPATGAQIARHGGIVIHNPLVSILAEAPEQEQRALLSHFFPPQHPERFFYEYAHMPGFFITDLEKGTVVPQFYNLYPTWLGIAFSLFGLEAGLLMTPYLSLLGGLGVLMVGRRLFGPWVGLAAYLFLSLNSLQVWFARYSTSEGATQFLTFLAIYALVRLEGAGPELEPGRPADPFFGLLTGVALGMVGLVRVDFFITWAFFLPYLAYRFVTHRFRRAHRLLLLGLGLLAVHTAVQITTLSGAYTLNSYFHRIQDWYTLSWLVWPFLTPILRHYFLGRTPVMHQPWRLFYELGAPLLLLGLLLLLRHRPRWRERASRWLQRHRRPLLAVAAGLVVLLAAYTYLIRPGILTAEALRHPLENRLTLEGYIGAPVAEGRAANMVRLGWYLSPLGIALAVAGIAAMIVRETSRRSWFLLLVGLFYTVLLVYELFGDPHHVYIMRRYVPVALPFLSLAMAYALGWLARQAWFRRAGPILAGGLGLLMVLYFAVTGRPFFRHTEYQGALDQVEALAGQFGPDDLLLLINQGRDTPYTVATPLQYLFDQPALGIRHLQPNGPLIEEQIGRWQDQGYQVYLLMGNDGGRLFLPHTHLRWLRRFELAVPEFEPLTAQKPHNSYTLRLPYGIYALAPRRDTPSPLGETPLTLDLGEGGYKYQVSGFHQDETDPDGTTYCWTDGRGVLRLPWPAEGGAVTITMRLAGGRRPAALGPAQVQVCLNEHCPAKWTLQEAFDRYSVSLAATAVPAQEGQTVLLEIRSSTWKQTAYDLGGDPRPLGVQVDWVRINAESR